MKLIKTKSDLLNLAENEIGAILTLEGCDAIGDQLEHLELLLSVRGPLGWANMEFCKSCCRWRT